MAVLAAIGVAIAIAWGIRHEPPALSSPTVAAVPPIHEAAKSPRTESKAVPRIAKSAPANAPKHALPPPLTPLGEAVQTLREYAEAGDTDAAVELSWRLSVCTEPALRRAETQARFEREDMERERADDTVALELRATRLANAQERLDEAETQRKACLALPADVRDGWLDWIDRAAQAGNTAAMRGYARVAARQYYTVDDVRNDLDAAIERRDKSRAYLDEALARGDAQALRDIANAYRDSALPTIYPMDPAKAYAYAYAGTLAGISRGNDLDRTMEETARLLDGKQLAEAEASGRRIYASCCEAH